MLKSSEGRGAIRVQFSKNPMGSRDYSRMMYAPMAGVQVPPGVPAGAPLAPVGGHIGAMSHMPGMYFVPAPDMPFPNDPNGPGAVHASNGDPINRSNDQTRASGAPSLLEH